MQILQSWEKVIVVLIMNTIMNLKKVKINVIIVMLHA